MPTPYFHFKQFTVYHDLCAMKVGTDGVLLGAWAPCENKKRILDIGTGSGLIALMLAQRCQAVIDAIDIDEGAFRQAEYNFSNSVWKGRLSVYLTSLQKFSNSSPCQYDLIVSNPPFFEQSLKSGNAQRDTARHTDTLPFKDLLEGSKKLLSPDGNISLIIPEDKLITVEDTAWEYDLHIQKMVTVSNKETNPPKRVLLTFGREKVSSIKENLFLRDKENKYTDVYRRLCSPFYLHI